MAASMKGQTLSALLGALALASLAASVVSPAVAAELTVAQELRMGQREHAGILQRFGGEYKDPKVAQYVTDVGKRLIATLPERAYDYTFTVLDFGDPYAFAMPGGYIYITRQMMLIANSEAELAAVLAHEVAHLSERHANQRSLLQDQLPGAAAGAAAEEWNRFNQEQELAADAVSIRMLAEAGYDPMAQARFLTAIGEHVELAQRAGEPRPSNPNTHPTITDRLRRATEAAQTVERDMTAGGAIADALAAGYLPAAEAERTPWTIGREPFLGVIDGVVYGRRPAEGMVLGATYVDTFNRYTFTLPPGFRFSRTRSNSISAEGPNGASMLFDMQQMRTAQTEGLGAYLRRSVISTFDLEQVEEQTVADMQAAFGRARVSGQDGVSAQVLFASIRVNPTTYFRFRFFLPGPLSADMADRALDAPLSLRRLTDAEARAISPMRIRVQASDPSTGLEALAAQMRMLDHPLEWLRMLNHLDAGAGVAAGDKVKVVVH